MAGYFKQYAGRDAFTGLETVCHLSGNVSVAAYDMDNGVFITQVPAAAEGTEWKYGYYYGLAGFDKIYQEPMYVNVVSVSGDHAIVVKVKTVGGVAWEDATADDLIETVGVIKFRNNGLEKGVIELTDFTVIYDDEYTQMEFVGDRYLAVCDSIDNVNNSASVSANGMYRKTFYDYKTANTLLEVFKANVKADTVQSMNVYDDNLVVVYHERAEFYNVNTIDDYGYVTVLSTYRPFVEDKTGEFTDYSTTMVAYLGNNWFLRWGYLQDTAEEDGDIASLAEAISGDLMKMHAIDEETGEDSEDWTYIFQRSDRFNSVSRVVMQNDIVPDNVVNKYSDSSSRAVASYVNNTFDENVLTEADGNGMYYPPSLPVSAMVTDGMSIVYYAYFPYDDEPYVPEYSFCFFDENGNMYHAKQNVLFPVLFVDGKGYQTDSPYYEMPYGDVAVLTLDNEIVTIKEQSENYGYVVTGINDGVIIVMRYDRKDVANFYYGAYDSSGRLITNTFKYNELSLYFGNYAVAAKKTDTGYFYYRVDKNGNETQLGDVYQIRNGVYVTRNDDGTLFGLKYFDGTVALECKYTAVSVIENFLIDGKYLESIVTATDADGNGHIYKLK